MAVLPVGTVGVERLLDEDEVVVAEAEAVKEGGAVLVAALDGGDDLSSGRKGEVHLSPTPEALGRHQACLRGGSLHYYMGGPILLCNVSIISMIRVASWKLCRGCILWQHHGNYAAYGPPAA